MRIILNLFVLLTLGCDSPNDQRFGVEEYIQKADTVYGSQTSTSESYADYTPDTSYFDEISIDSTGLVQWTLRNDDVNIKFEIRYTPARAR